jgi:hypothetical protein
MAVDNRIRTIDGLKDTDEPWKAYRDIDATNETFAKYYAGGTPDWMKWPSDYKNFAREEFLKVREESEAMALEYQLEDQADLTNRAARMVNPMSTRDFIAKLRANGVKCFSVDNGFPPQTVALWCMPPRQNQRARYIAYMQIPAMYEWSVLKTDEYGKPMGEDFRGWRTVLMQLIEKEILTEVQAHQIFGHPSQNPVFSRYHQSLWEVRNGRKYTETELHANDF